MGRPLRMRFGSPDTDARRRDDRIIRSTPTSSGAYEGLPDIESLTWSTSSSTGSPGPSEPAVEPEPDRIASFNVDALDRAETFYSSELRQKFTRQARCGSSPRSTAMQPSASAQKDFQSLYQEQRASTYLSEQPRVAKVGIVSKFMQSNSDIQESVIRRWAILAEKKFQVDRRFRKRAEQDPEGRSPAQIKNDRQRRYRADAAKRDPDGRTATQIAAARRKQRFEDLSARDPEGRSPLQIQTDCRKRYFERLAQFDSQGRTAAQIATDRTMQSLINAAKRDPQGRTPREIANARQRKSREKRLNANAVLRAVDSPSLILHKNAVAASKVMVPLEPPLSARRTVVDDDLAGRTATASAARAPSDRPQVQARKSTGGTAQESRRPSPARHPDNEDEASKLRANLNHPPDLDADDDRCSVFDGALIEFMNDARIPLVGYGNDHVVFLSLDVDHR